MEEETHWPRVDPTTPVMNPYEFIPIPPPPPLQKKRRTRLIVLSIALIVLVVSTGGAYATVTSYQQTIHTEKIQSDARGTANAHSVSTVFSQNTDVAATHIAINATSTQISSNVTATVISSSIDATLTASIPTPTPMPAVNTAEDLYAQFINAGIAMGDAGVISNSQWLQDGYSYYPGRGNVSFIDETSYGKMVITLFNTVHGASTDASQTAGGGWGTYRLGTCLLFYQSANTNLTPYEQVMQQYCS